MAPLSPLQIKIQQRLAEMRAAKENRNVPTIETVKAGLQTNSDRISHLQPNHATTHSAGAGTGESTIVISEHGASPNSATDRFGNVIHYNERQQLAVDTISSGKSCVVIGAAGTGKTTIQKGSTSALVQSGRAAPLQSSHGHKHLKVGAPGIAIVAYTRRATNNIRKNLSEDLQSCCMTIHKLLEYEPVEVYIPTEDGGERRSMRFEPTRNAENPLPASLTTIVIEEASMVSVELFRQIVAACPHNPQYVFLGDIQQLPPVFGSAILGFKMLELPVIELTEVYRQALESPILSLAHRILSGKAIPGSEFKAMNVPDKLRLHAWVKKIGAEAATDTLAKFFLKELENGKYNPEEDGILIPFNKACGTLELNRHIATKIAQRQFRPVYEIIHGWKRSYYSVGDKCLYEKEDAIIKSIEENPQYVGMKPREASLDMNYWGNGGNEASGDDIDAFLSSVATGEEDGDKKMRAASHIITLELLDSERTVRLRSAGEIDALDLGYAITIHKSQGSEWNKVYLCLHNTHAVMIQRELLYTAVTRAKQELFCICEADTFDRGITRQRIKGNSWKEKAEYFKGRLENGDLQS